LAVSPKLTVTVNIPSQIKSALSGFFATRIYDESRAIDTGGSGEALNKALPWPPCRGQSDAGRQQPLNFEKFT
jgi:hypothetical protein